VALLRATSIAAAAFSIREPLSVPSCGVSAIPALTATRISRSSMRIGRVSESIRRRVTRSAASPPSIEGSTNSDRVFGAVNVNAFYPTGNWILSGRAGLLFAKDDVDEFVEQTGLPGGLVNPEQRFRIAQGRLGGDVGYSLGAWEPFVSAHLVHDFTRTAVQVGPGQRQPSEDDTEVELGFGVRYFDERHDVSGALEFISVQGRDDIDSQSVNLNVRVKF